MPLAVASGVPGSSVISSFTALQSVLKEAALLRHSLFSAPYSVLHTDTTHAPSASWQNALALPRPLFAYEPCHAMPCHHHSPAPFFLAHSFLFCPPALLPLGFSSPQSYYCCASGRVCHSLLHQRLAVFASFPFFSSLSYSTCLPGPGLLVD